ETLDGVRLPRIGLDGLDRPVDVPALAGRLPAGQRVRVLVPGGEQQGQQQGLLERRGDDRVVHQTGRVRDLGPEHAGQVGEGLPRPPARGPPPPRATPRRPRPGASSRSSSWSSRAGRSTLRASRWQSALERCRTFSPTGRYTPARPVSPVISRPPWPAAKLPASGRLTWELPDSSLPPVISAPHRPPAGGRRPRVKKDN